MEAWKKTPLAPDFVEVSDLGRVRVLERATTGIRCGKPAVQIKKAAVLSPWLGNNGYLYVAIQFDGKRPKFLVHRLIASAFCDGFDADLSVNHKDGVKTNNLPVNLEWVTLARNSEHQWETGLVDLKGESHPLSRIKTADVVAIRERFNSGTPRKEIAAEFGVSISTVYKIMSGDRWASVA